MPVANVPTSMSAKLTSTNVPRTRSASTLTEATSVKITISAHSTKANVENTANVSTRLLENVFTHATATKATHLTKKSVPARTSTNVKRKTHAAKTTHATTLTALTSAARKAKSSLTENVKTGATTFAQKDSLVVLIRTAHLCARQSVPRMRFLTKLPTSASPNQPRLNQLPRLPLRPPPRRQLKLRRKLRRPRRSRLLRRKKLRLVRPGARRVSNQIQITTLVLDDDVESGWYELLPPVPSTRTRTVSANVLILTNVIKKESLSVLVKNQTAGTIGVATDATILIQKVKVTSVTISMKLTRSRCTVTTANASPATIYALTRPLALPMTNAKRLTTTSSSLTNLSNAPLDKSLTADFAWKRALPLLAMMMLLLPARRRAVKSLA